MHWIEEIISQHGFPVKEVQKSVETTRRLNAFLETEILIPHPELRFAEWGGYLRRGSPEYNSSVPQTMKKYFSAAFFEREEWPLLLWNPSNQPAGFIWVLNYEKAPEYLSSASLVIGYQFNHDFSADATPEETKQRIVQIEKRPFFLRSSYEQAEKRRMVVSTAEEMIESLRKELQQINYQREALSTPEMKN